MIADRGPGIRAVVDRSRPRPRRRTLPREAGAPQGPERRHRHRPARVARRPRPRREARRGTSAVAERARRQPGRLARGGVRGRAGRRLGETVRPHGVGEASPAGAGMGHGHRADRAPAARRSASGRDDARARRYGVGLVSIPALGAVGSTSGCTRRGRARGAGCSAKAPPTVPTSGAMRGSEHAAPSSPLELPVEARQRHGALRFTQLAVSNNLRLLAGMIRANRPARVMARLSRSSTAALGTGAYALSSSGFWSIAHESTWPRLVAVGSAVHAHHPGIARPRARPVGAHRATPPPASVSCCSTSSRSRRSPSASRRCTSPCSSSWPSRPRSRSRPPRSRTRSPRRRPSASTRGSRGSRRRSATVGGALGSLVESDHAVRDAMHAPGAGGRRPQPPAEPSPLVFAELGDDRDGPLRSIPTIQFLTLSELGAAIAVIPDAIVHGKPSQGRAAAPDRVAAPKDPRGRHVGRDHGPAGPGHHHPPTRRRRDGRWLPLVRTRRPRHSPIPALSGCGSPSVARRSRAPAGPAGRAAPRGSRSRCPGGRWS